MNLAIVGLGHGFQKQYNALKQNKNINRIELCDTDINKLKEYNCKSNYLLLNSDNVLVATPPKLHLDMIKSLVTQGKKIIVEKPAVISIKELEELKRITNDKNYYNSLHFSFGLEIDYFIKNINKIPNKVYCYISDNYVYDKAIIDSAISLCGSYLDETINPLSALVRMFGYNIIFISCEKQKFAKDLYDYYSYSKFKIENIPVDIKVIWDNKKSQKYIDLYFDNYIIRLDSMNQSVINLNKNEIIFSATGDRMTNHYIGVYNDYIKNGSNYYKSLKLHKELLKGSDNYKK